MHYIPKVYMSIDQEHYVPIEHYIYKYIYHTETTLRKTTYSTGGHAMNQTTALTQPPLDPYTVNVLRSQFHMQLDAWLDGL